MPRTVSRISIDIYTDEPLVPIITDSLRAQGVSGWSIVAMMGGHGRSGDWHEDALTGASGKVIVRSIVKAETADQIIDALSPILDSYGLMLTSVAVNVVRGERFS